MESNQQGESPSHVARLSQYIGKASFASEADRQSAIVCLSELTASFQKRIASLAADRHYWCDVAFGVRRYCDEMNANGSTEGERKMARDVRRMLAEPPNPDYPCRDDGRCQYAIDHGAEGMGHCPRGKCVMAAT